MLTRQHFILMADAMKAIKPVKRGPLLSQWKKDLFFMCDTFKENTPRFDRAKFLDACGYENKTKPVRRVCSNALISDKGKERRFFGNFN